MNSSKYNLQNTNTTPVANIDVCILTLHGSHWIAKEAVMGKIGKSTTLPLLHQSTLLKWVV